MINNAPPHVETPERISTSPKSAPFPGSIPPTPIENIDHALKTLQASKDKWVSFDFNDRIAILDQIMVDLELVENRWVEESMQAKCIPSNTNGEGEEWVFFGLTYRIVSLLRQSLLDLRKNQSPRIGGPIKTHSDGHVVARVFPQSLSDRILFPGTTGEVWMDPGMTKKGVIKTQGRIYKDKDHKGKVVLVLGGGNVSILPPGDTLHKLFVEDQVVILKLHPVNDYLGPLIEEGFQALIKRGFLRIIYGDVKEGNYICNHSLVDEIHLTGAINTFEAILFGNGTERSERKAARNPILTKRFTAELGNVSPVIVVPGPWSKKDITTIATLLASRLTDNSSFNCNAPRVIIQHKNWSLRDELTSAIGNVMEDVPTRKAYYPGANDRHEEFLTEHPEALQFGDTQEGHLPWTIIPDVDPHNTDDICFKKEVFCSLFAETVIDAPSVTSFLEKAVEFANNTLWGNLCATIIVHPKSMKDDIVSTAVNRAIADLHYRTIVINDYAGYSFILFTTPWGGYPGNDIYDAQSGLGAVNNVLMFENHQKSVVYTPFHKMVDPLSVTVKNGHQFGKRFAHYMRSQSISNLTKLIWTVLLGKLS